MLTSPIFHAGLHTQSCVSQLAVSNRVKGSYCTHCVYLIDSTEKFQYDVFLSYAADTEEFAEKVIRRGLKDRGYKVQTPIDFLVGHAIDENIIDAYTASRYIVILFSEKYSQSNPEFIHAFNKLKMTKTNCLVPVICGGILPEALKHITYSDFEVDDVVSRVAVTIGEINIIYCHYVAYCKTLNLQLAMEYI